jgi:hypothetical protein
MTLSTYIVVGSPDVDHASIYNFLRPLVVTPPQAKCEVTENSGLVHIDNAPGIGAYAWLLTKRNQDRTPFVHTCDEWCEDVVGERTITRHDGTLYTFTITAEEVEWHDENRIKDYHQNGQGYISINFDTSYSFHKEHPDFPQLGELNCTTLHAWLITQFGVWMIENHPDVPWWWRNEYTGEWFERLDGLGLEQFVGAEFDRARWFECSLKPALAAVAEQVDCDIVWHGGQKIPEESRS